MGLPLLFPFTPITGPLIPSPSPARGEGGKPVQLILKQFVGNLMRVHQLQGIEMTM